MPQAEESGWPEFEDFYRAQFHGVAGVVYLVLGDREDAWDVTQESFARTWLAWERVRRHDRPVAFTFRVAVNLARSHLRRRATLRRLLPLVPNLGMDSAPDPRIDERLVIEGALRGLAPRQRWAVVLCDMAELTSEEAARVLHSKASTVRVHLARGRAALRTALSEPPSGSPGPMDPSTRGPVE